MAICAVHFFVTPAEDGQGDGEERTAALNPDPPIIFGLARESCGEQTHLRWLTGHLR
jgi:hypothetical protein